MRTAKARLLMTTLVSSSLAQVALVVVKQLRKKLDLDHARQVITISRGLRRLGRLVVDRVKYTYLGIKPSFSHRPGTSLREAAGGVSECPRTVTGGIRGPPYAPCQISRIRFIFRKRESF